MIKKMSDSTADTVIGPFDDLPVIQLRPQVVPADHPDRANDFDHDLYELRKMVSGIFEALDNATAAGKFGFIGKELADDSALIHDPAIEALEFTMPLPSWEDA